jgi:hypothetical protein
VTRKCSRRNLLRHAAGIVAILGTGMTSAMAGKMSQASVRYQLGRQVRDEPRPCKGLICGKADGC